MGCPYQETHGSRHVGWPWGHTFDGALTSSTRLADWFPALDLRDAESLLEMATRRRASRILCGH
jgi:hypothetical protein